MMALLSLNYIFRCGKATAEWHDSVQSSQWLVHGYYRERNANAFVEVLQ